MPFSDDVHILADKPDALLLGDVNRGARIGLYGQDIRLVGVHQRLCNGTLIGRGIPVAGELGIHVDVFVEQLPHPAHPG